MMIAMSRLEKLWDRYQAQVCEYCKEQFEEYVKPYCVKHDYEFTTGNGTWFIQDWTDWCDAEIEGVNPDDIHPLYKILTEEIPGMPDNDVGSLMPSHRRTNEH